MHQSSWLVWLLAGVLGFSCLGRSPAEARSSVLVASAMGDRITGRAFATRSEVIARHGMACTSQPLATQVAVEILKRGGTAVDAAIAANAVLGVVEPTGCGIGGDLLALVWDPKTKRLYGLNASGRSPKRLTLDEFRRRNL
jgi:gamma-glutamyltranspeptidase/glutathione hydrolase